MKKLEKLQQSVGYKFKDERLLQRALTHTSYANECNEGHNKSNERLEFLGDSVLGIITAEHFYLNFKDLPEGELTKLRAATVCENSLSSFARQLGLGEYLLLGKGEMCTGGSDRPSILADAFEALIAAIYLDGGIEEAKKFVLKYVDKAVEEHRGFKDYKTVLQEVIQKNPGEVIEYVLVKESGPDHNKRFEVEVHLNSNVIGKGVGTSKKKAEQLAAKEALELMGL
ncbi:MAG: ribonuclease III [Ruminococcus sp.]|jgi:ribonuclease-3|nr:ribonuclease III [Ruminococcus sp.]MDD7337216.1 ribonuclease III [Ruminococcus sp.]